MAENYVLLERIELNASAASVTFSNIPQSGYTDLKIVMSVRSDRAASTWDYINVAFNGSGTSYSYRYVSGNGTSAASGSLSLLYGGDIPAVNATASTFCNTELYIPNYTSTTAAKSVSFDTSAENNATAGFLYLGAGLWNPGTQAGITSIAFTSGNSANFVANSTFSLYGLAAVGTTPAIAPKASGGNITTDGTYWIHTFLTTDVFTPQTNLTCDYLVVAGGGGGGAGGGGGRGGGGGGAGGYRTTVGTSGGGASAESPLAVTANTNYAITVGAGGAAGVSYSSGVQGTNSTFSTITSIGGGYGSSYAAVGGNGGSGGGAGDGYTTTFAGGSGTANQGYAGGSNGGTSGGNNGQSGAGGGGAGSVGTSQPQTGGSNNNNAGGSGVSSSITGSAVTRAAGGTGWARSSNGGGSAGTTNTGNGGDGNGYNGNGGAGGSGIVIIRYAMV